MKLTFNAESEFLSGRTVVNLEREGPDLHAWFLTTAAESLTFPNQKSRRKRLRLRDTNLLGKIRT